MAENLTRQILADGRAEPGQTARMPRLREELERTEPQREEREQGVDRAG
jgi:hypothetical protein